jgi:hypothetical protein
MSGNMVAGRASAKHICEGMNLDITDDEDCAPAKHLRVFAPRHEWLKVLAGCLALMMGASAPTAALYLLDRPEWYAKPDWWIAGFTAALFVATTGLWVFTAMLWHTTRRAVTGGEEAIKAAVASAKAASEQAVYTERAVKISEETAMRQLRAYVGVDDVSFECPSESIQHYEPMDIDKKQPIYTDYTAITIKNFGSTPAKEVRVRSAILQTNYLGAIDDSNVIEDILTKTHQRGRETVPTLYLNIGQPNINKEVIPDIRFISRARNKEITIYLAGRIYYRDIFDQAWSTMFCYVWEPWHSLGERFVPYERFNGGDKAVYPETLEYSAFPTNIATGP